MAKMYRIAQLQIQYILVGFNVEVFNCKHGPFQQSQQTLVKELELEREKVAKVNKINQAFRKSLMQTQRSSRELFKVSVGKKSCLNLMLPFGKTVTLILQCDECSKIFLHSTFLADHIQRKHRSSGNVLANVDAETPKHSTSNHAWK